MQELFKESFMYPLLKYTYYLWNDNDYIAKVKKHIVLTNHNDEDCVDLECGLCIKKLKYEMKNNFDYVEDITKLLKTMFNHHLLQVQDIKVQYFEAVKFFPIVIHFKTLSGNNVYRMVYYENGDNKKGLTIKIEGGEEKNIDILLLENRLLNEEEMKEWNEIKTELGFKLN